VTGNDITRPQVTESDPEVTSFDQKSPESGCRKTTTRVYCTFHFLQGCSQWRRQSRDRKWLMWPQM